MKLADSIRLAIFLERLNRFEALVDINNRNELIHIPNPGRMKELLIPGCEIVLREVNSPNRKTKYDLLGIIKNGVHISLDSNAPNKIFMEALLKKRIYEFNDVLDIKKEIKIGNSRLDFLLFDKKGKIYIEIKSCTLVENEIALFPDAPTSRGVRHLMELKEIVKRGDRGAIIFIIQRPDAKIFMPNYKTDPTFSNKLVEVYNSGVDVFAYDCQVNLPFIELNKKIRIKL
ncbi:MAG: DNA/RNA nuclease SfsA [Candidatus Helarchaeota archaeon]